MLGGGNVGKGAFKVAMIMAFIASISSNVRGYSDIGKSSFYKAPTLRAQFAKKKRYKKNKRK